MKNGVGRGDRGEQCRAGSELEVIRRAHDLRRRSVFNAKQRLGNLYKAWTENRMGEVSPSLIEAPDGVAFGHGAVPEPVDLWKDEPHPVAALKPGTDFEKGVLVSVLLGVEESPEVERVGGRCIGHDLEV